VVSDGVVESATRFLAILICLNVWLWWGGGGGSIARVTTRFTSVAYPYLVAYPDLVVTAVSAPARRVFPNGELRIAYTLRKPVRGAFFEDIVVLPYLSRDATITREDTLLWRRAPDTTGSHEILVRVSPEASPGTYYMGVIVGYRDDLVETDKTNNALAGPMITVAVPEVDLAMTMVSTQVKEVLPWEELPITYTVKNYGPSAAEFVKVSFYLSRDITITRNDTYVAHHNVGDLATGESSEGRVSEVLHGLALGTYYLGAIVNDQQLTHGDDQIETNAINNVLTGPTIRVIPTDFDLLMTAINTQVLRVPSGGNLLITDTVKNQGSTAMPPMHNFGVAFYLSSDAIITPDDIQVCTRWAGSLAAGRSDSGTKECIVPPSLMPGAYYLGAIADNNSGEAERNTANNALSGPRVTVVAPDVDLVMTAVSTSAKNVPSGGDLLITDTVKNIGPVAMTIASHVGLYLSSDATMTTADTRLGTRWVGGLGAGASHSGTTRWAVPPHLMPGTYYLGAIADDGNRQPENEETHNALTGGTITVVAPDLVLITVDMPRRSVSPGEHFPITDTVKNRGTVATVTGFWVGLYLSADATITREDMRIGQHWVGKGLIAETSFSGTGEGKLPPTLTPGLYYLGAIADHGNRQAESDETNNTLSGPTLTVLITDVPKGAPGGDEQ